MIAGGELNVIEQLKLNKSAHFSICIFAMENKCKCSKYAKVRKHMQRDAKVCNSMQKKVKLVKSIEK